MDLRWSAAAYKVAVEAGKADEWTRRRWAAKNRWDAEHMCTESTRFTVKLDQELRRCCKEAGVTRYTLISYLLQTWMAAWEAYR